LVEPEDWALVVLVVPVVRVVRVVGWGLGFACSSDRASHRHGQ
jgi:hypothetical protein